MIETLSIKNIGIIEDLSIDFNKGLNVLTGETGAGKTLIIDSLQIICGGRFSKEMIRKGEKYSFVELSMYEPNSNTNSIDGNIIVSREIYTNGKNMCKINGRMVTVTELKDFMSSYIEIHGQNDNQNLLDNKKHIKYLDDFIGKELKDSLKKYKENYERYLKLKSELKLNYGDDKEKQRRLDLLNYQLKEINNAKLRLNEEEELVEKRKIIMNAEKIISMLRQADEYISNNAIDSISNAIRNLEKIENIDKKYKNVSTNIKNAYYELQEASRDILEFKEEVDFEEEERIYTEERLDLINALKRKYGNNIFEILKYKDEVKKEISNIENSEEKLIELKEEQKLVADKLEELSFKIHKIRKVKAEELSNNINKELIDLEMKNASINISVEYLKEEFLSNGKDNVVFYIKTNIGEDEKELSKIASGGEMSRIMLAIKKVLSQTDDIRCIVFDEIDTGISGKTANSVAKKLKAIGKGCQVLVISHLSNIAAIADFNYFISKEVNSNRTISNVRLLKEPEVINEIARMSSGEINEITLKFARELRNKKVV